MEEKREKKGFKRCSGFQNVFLSAGQTWIINIRLHSFIETETGPQKGLSQLSKTYWKKALLESDCLISAWMIFFLEEGGPETC